MTETGWIIAEIFVGIAFLTLLTAVVSRLMGDGSKRRTPVEILDERYAQGELTREQYQQMRQDLGFTAGSGERFAASHTERRDTTMLSGMHQPK